MSENCWIPKLEYFEDYNTGDDYSKSWQSYQDVLYEIFKRDFIDSHPTFEDKNVNIRRHPMSFGKEEAFFHTTCQDYLKDGERVPDFRRCERIRWIRAFIENYNCDPSRCDDCDGIKVWSEPYKNTTRVHLLLAEERYMVVLERRESYCLLITAFYFEHDHALEKKLKHYEAYKAK